MRDYDAVVVGVGYFMVRGGDGKRDLRAALARFLATHPALREGRTFLQQGPASR